MKHIIRNFPFVLLVLMTSLIFSSCSSNKSSKKQDSSYSGESSINSSNQSNDSSIESESSVPIGDSGNNDPTPRDETNLPFKVIYSLYGGANNEKNPHRFGEEENLTLYPASKDHYCFCGWYLDYRFETPIEKITNINHDVTLYAKFDRLSNYLLFDDTGEVLEKVYHSSISKIVIPEGVKKIADAAFGYCSNVKEVVLPSTIETIGYSAFMHCTALESINIPQKVKTVYYQTFVHCQNLKRISFPDGLEAIEDSAFANCYSLEEISFSKTISRIVSSAFAYCPSIKSITIDSHNNKYYCPQGGNCLISKDDKSLVVACSSTRINEPLSSIERLVFSGRRSLPEFDNILSHCSAIGHFAFASCDFINEVTIPNNIKNIADNVFANCLNLKSLYINADVESISAYLFAQDIKSLEALRIGKSINDIRLLDGSHLNLKKLRSIEVDNANLNYSSFDGCLYDYSKETLFCVPCAKENIVFPTSINKIVYGAINSSRLKNIDVPSSVQTIESRNFVNCEELETINFLGDLSEIKAGCICQCPSLKTLVLPNGLLKIERNCFMENQMLEEITFNQQLLEISNLSFSNNPKIETIVLPESLVTLGNGAFSNCQSLKKIVLPKNLASLPYGFCLDCPSLHEVIWPNQLDNVEPYCFGNCYNFIDDFAAQKQIEQGIDVCFSGEVEEFTIPKGTKSITNLSINATKLIIPASLESFNNIPFVKGDFVVDENNQFFCSIDGLLYSKDKKTLISCPTNKEEVVVDENCEVIEEKAFSQCYDLKKLTLVNNFDYGLQKKFFRENIERIIVSENNDYYCFENGILYNKSKSKIILALNNVSPRYLMEDTVSEIEEGAFNYIDTLETVTFSSSLSSINLWDFSNCKNLKEINVPGKEQMIKIYKTMAFRFYGCSSLERFNICDGNINLIYKNGLLIDKKTKELLYVTREASEVLYIDEDIIGLGNSCLSICHTFIKEIYIHKHISYIYYLNLSDDVERIDIYFENTQAELNEKDVGSLPGSDTLFRPRSIFYHFGYYC